MTERVSTRSGFGGYGNDDAMNDRIWIPAGHHGVALESIPVSTRLRHVLEAADLWRLGDLHGQSLGTIAAFPHCGSRTMAELMRLVLRHDGNGGELGGLFYMPGKFDRMRSGKRFVVSPAVAHLAIDELPLSVRLERVLREYGCRCLGDLHGDRHADLFAINGCGDRSMRELLRVLRRAKAGEFSAVGEEDFDAVLRSAAACIDKGMKEVLSERNEGIVDAHFGGKYPLWTLGQVGCQFGLSKESVRQIVNKSNRRLLKAGGPVLRRTLERIEETCARGSFRLTPRVFALNLERRPEFYLRILSAWNPAIPVELPEGRWKKTIETESALVFKENWKAMYQRLSELRGKDGRLRLAPALPDLRRLAEWLLDQTLRHASLSQDQIKKLLDLGLNFGDRPTKWYSCFFEIRAHLRRHGRISSCGSQGRWIATQRDRRETGGAFNMQQIAWMNDLETRFEPWKRRRSKPRKSSR